MTPAERVVALRVLVLRPRLLREVGEPGASQRCQARTMSQPRDGRRWERYGADEALAERNAHTGRFTQHGNESWTSRRGFCSKRVQETRGVSMFHGRRFTLHAALAMNPGPVDQHPQGGGTSTQDAHCLFHKATRKKLVFGARCNYGLPTCSHVRSSRVIGSRGEALSRGTHVAAFRRPPLRETDRSVLPRIPCPPSMRSRPCRAKRLRQMQGQVQVLVRMPGGEGLSRDAKQPGTQQPSVASPSPSSCPVKSWQAGEVTNSATKHHAHDRRASVAALPSTQPSHTAVLSVPRAPTRQVLS